MNYSEQKTQLDQQGYATIPAVYSNKEIAEILACIENADQNSPGFLKTNDLFAIRQLLITIPKLGQLIFTENLQEFISSFLESRFFLTKAIYFDKPSTSNWFVGYHQDLSIAINQKEDIPGYINWTFKKGQHGVQPPIEILEDTLTVRIHLDDTDEKNGALKVIPKSHLKGILRIDKEDIGKENEVICAIDRGGLMLMKPLTLHASNRTINKKQRRVIHLEFNHHELSPPLKWNERYQVNN